MMHDACMHACMQRERVCVCVCDTLDACLLLKKEFYAPFGTVIFCHAIWNSGSLIPFMGQYIICGLISWTVALSLLNLGINQIAEEKSGKEIFRSD